MLKKAQIDEIKILLNSGYNFDLELIAFEYNTNLDEIIKIKQELDFEKSKKAEIEEILAAGRKQLKKQNNRTISSIEAIKKRYEKQLNHGKPTYTIIRRELTDTQREFVEEMIQIIEKIIENNKDSSKKERRDQLTIILKNIRKILNLKCDLSSDQYARLWNILDSNMFTNLYLYTNDNIVVVLKRTRREVSKLLGDAISYEKQEAKDDIEKLKTLGEIITHRMCEVDYLNLGSLKNTITAQINSIKSKQRQEKIKRYIPEDLIEIITDLSNSTLDVETAKKIIEDLVEKRNQDSTNKKQKLTNEEQKKAIFSQIQRVFERTSR